jgi:hypothetical protein
VTTPNLPQDPLADLRGWHFPEPVSWWPPAAGWWVLGLLVVLLAAILIRWLLVRYRARAAARAAQRELRDLQAAFATDGDAGAFARGISRLLRRFALACFPRRQIAGLAGADWLAFLDAHGGNGRFRDGPGRVLVEAPYRPVDAIPAEELVALVREWIALNEGGRA